MMLGNDALYHHGRLRRTSVLLVLGYLTSQIAQNYNEAARLEPEKWKGIGETKLIPKKLTREEKQRVFAEGVKRAKEEAAKNGR